MARTTGSDGEKTRSAIDAAAKRLIAKIGYEAMTMRQLADEVGVQSAAFYRYYPNKQELLFSLMHDHMDRLLGAWEYESRKAHTPLERLSAFIRFHIRYHVERRDDVHIGNMELRSLSPENRAFIVELRSRYENGLREILDDGLDAREFVIDDIALTTRAIIAMTTGVNLWFRADDRLTVAEIAEKYVQMGLRLVGAKNIATTRTGGRNVSVGPKIRTF
ncbi:MULTISPECIES: TetR/AcrR family transcriptional regulator [Phyllobacterium]|jgi:AcrR family transcriptional regulator|uniref:TetR/AcrR family transcriptional regulator n=1 Tax=Phyllobacterium sophorae TaxID=1520277 RepID=A0A2P7ATQ9_9HYPH|nr:MULTISPECIES: TetR/AcrR family transcriptional regulator [Phyllobacterium]PSH57587.1 TetR/AcrR family transcriptional regulator [Phyllobacterium sophorae]UXN63503.1 TetR/AcrR family transcriptional regulator [Phyllobacterium sp. A18/5-2]